MAEIVPDRYLQARRPIEEQLDVRNLLAALGQNFQQPSTHYVGLKPEEITSDSQSTLNTLKAQQQMLQNAQEMGINQERAQFADALNAQQAWLREQELQLQKAAAARAAASAGRSVETHELEKQLLKLRLKEQEQKNAFGAASPELIYGKSRTTAKPTQWEANQNAFSSQAEDIRKKGGSQQLSDMVGRIGFDKTLQLLNKTIKDGGTSNPMYGFMPTEERIEFDNNIANSQLGFSPIDLSILRGGVQASPANKEVILQTQQQPVITPEMQEKMQLFLNSYIDKKNKQ